MRTNLHDQHPTSHAGTGGVVRRRSRHTSITAAVALLLLAATATATASFPAAGAEASTNAARGSSRASSGGWLVIQAGAISTCGIRSNGTLWCWGADNNGELGDGDPTGTHKPLPVQVGRQRSWTAISAGGQHACGLRTDHSLWCWGLNDHGQVGDGTHEVRRTPTQIAPQTMWASVSAGESGTCAVSTDGDGWCWGWNVYGALGDGEHGEGADSATPVPVSGGYQWSDIELGDFHTCGVQVDGSLWCWGDGRFGQLGDGTFGGDVLSDVPLQVGGDQDWTRVVAGSGRSFALKTDLTLWGWGSNAFGALGVAPGSRHRLRPTQVGRDLRWRDIFPGDIHTCAVSSTDELWCWGDNQYGELGDGTYQQRNRPERIVKGHVWVDVEAGYYHGCAIQDNGTGWCWGVNQEGELGTGTFDDSNVPVAVTKGRERDGS